MRQNRIEFSEHVYDYIEHGGALESARQLGLPDNQVVKTLIMQDERSQPLVVLMHGNAKVSTKNLARQIKCKLVEPCKPEVAQRHSGYLVGGTSPFATRKSMPVYVEASILSFEKIFINGGRRGYLIGIAPAILTEALQARPVTCALLEDPE